MKITSIEETQTCQISQVAFGIGDIDGNPDLLRMFAYAREKGVVPNITINGYRMTEHIANRLSILCGAVAVSLYSEDATYDTVKALTERGMNQVNIHALVAQETIGQLYKLVSDIGNDPRLDKLNAVVFLSLKQRGRGQGYHILEKDMYRELVETCLDRKIRFGMDSCSAHKFMGVLSPEMRERMEIYVEPCESTLFSAYINVEGRFFPCSFGEDGEGLDVVGCDDFLQDIWYHPDTIAFRRNLIQGGRKCPLYEI